MGPAATTACGVLVGLIVFLAMAVLGVVAVNGTDNPGFARQASAAAGGTAGTAGKAPPAAKDGFNSLDLDKDGKLTLAEAAGYAEIVTRFDRADGNRDGKLTQAEFDRLAKLPPAKAPKAKAKVSKKPPSRAEATAAAGG
jgi:hypothetical protein